MYPFINIFGKSFGTYGLCMVLGFALVFYLAWRKGRKTGLIVEDLFIVTAFVLGFAAFCGGLLYAFVTFTPAQIWALLKAGDFSFLSGIVFYGGLIGGILGALVGLKVAKCKFEPMAAAIVPFIPLGHAVGRVGCVMAGCCHGFAYDGPFALYYPKSVLGLSPHQGYFPVQLLEGLINCFICLLLLWFEKKVKRGIKVLFAYLCLYAISRFFLEMLRGDAVRGLWYALSTSQIISLLLLAVGVVGLLWKSKAKTE